MSARGPYDWCINCVFWVRDGETQSGTCHRRAPVAAIVSEQSPGGNALQPSIYSAWPATLADHWCGDFSVKDGTVLFPLSAQLAGRQQ